MRAPVHQARLDCFGQHPESSERRGRTLGASRPPAAESFRLRRIAPFTSSGLIFRKLLIYLQLVTANVRPSIGEILSAQRRIRGQVTQRRFFRSDELVQGATREFAF